MLIDFIYIFAMIFEMLRFSSMLDFMMIIYFHY